MAVTLPLIAKGLAGVGVVGVATTGIVCREGIYEFVTGEINYQKYLKLPSNCRLGKDGCEISAEQLKKVNFEGWKETWTTDGTAKLKIEKTNDLDHFHKGLKFVFITGKNVEIKEGNEAKIKLKANTNTEFKLVEKDGGYFLKQAWDLTSLAKRVGLTCPKDGNNSTDCTATTENQKINVFKEEEDHVVNAQLPGSKTIKFTKDAEGYNQGFKFTVDEDVTLTTTGSTQKKPNGGISKLTKEGKSYEIGMRENKWFLIEKDNQTVREELVGMTCETQGDSTTCSGKSISGITEKSGITRTTETDGSKYPDKHKYAVGTKSYKIDNSDGQYKLTEVTSQ